MSKPALAKPSKNEESTLLPAYTLKHSFASHLLENGTDLWYIQYLPGYATIKHLLDQRCMADKRNLLCLPNCYPTYKKDSDVIK